MQGSLDDDVIRCLQEGEESSCNRLTYYSASVPGMTPYEEPTRRHFDGADGHRLDMATAFGRPQGVARTFSAEEVNRFFNLSRLNFRHDSPAHRFASFNTVRTRGPTTHRAVTSVQLRPSAGKLSITTTKNNVI